MSTPDAHAASSTPRSSTQGLLRSVKQLSILTATRRILLHTARGQRKGRYNIPHRPTICPKTCSANVRDELSQYLNESLSHGRFFPAHGVSTRRPAT